MDVLIVTTESHRTLSDAFFRPSLASTSPGNVLERRLDLVGQGGYESESWQQGVTAKLGWALDHMATLPAGAVFVLSDVDIQFFQGFSMDELSATLARSGTDVLFQKEHATDDSKLVNTGFYVARNTPWMKDLLERALELCDKAEVKNDQTAINELLDPSELGTRWGFLPLSFYARTHGFPPPAGVVMHHANFSGSVPEKMGQLGRVRKFVTGGTLDKLAARVSEGWDFARSGKLRMTVRSKIGR